MPGICTPPLGNAGLLAGNTTALLCTSETGVSGMGASDGTLETTVIPLNNHSPTLQAAGAPTGSSNAACLCSSGFLKNRLKKPLANHGGIEKKELPQLSTNIKRN